MNAPAQRVGFVGTGVMGAPVVGNLVRAGHHVQVYGRSKGSRERARDVGASIVDDLREVPRDADVVMTMVADSPDVEEVVAALEPVVVLGQLFVDLSTISPATSRGVADTLGGRGVDVLDAPVSGGEQAAVDGTLSVMVGGDAGVVDRVRPLLGAVATKVTHVGPHGSGQLTKAANQLVVALGLQALAEAVVLLGGAEVDLPAALEAIAGGLGGSTVLDRKRKSYLEGSYQPGFRLALHDKDLRIVAATASEQGAVLPLTALVSQLVRAMVVRGDGDLDHSALLQLAKELNGQRPALASSNGSSRG